MPTHFVWVTGIQVCFFTFFQLIFNEPPLFFLKKRRKRLPVPQRNRQKQKTTALVSGIPKATPPLSQGFLGGLERQQGDREAARNTPRSDIKITAK